MFNLYERWLHIAQERAHEIALQDSHQEWTFAELRRKIEDEPKISNAIVYPRGNSADFILEVLRGWRSQALVCPLELDQSSPRLHQPAKSYAHYKTTSATTGGARGVIFTGDQLAADAANIVETMGLRPDWTNLGAISLAHSYGFSNLVLPLLLHGIPLKLIPFPLPELLRDAAKPLSGIILPAVPALWRAWLETKALPENVRLAISAGAPLPAKLEREVFEATGIKIHNFYGSTECGGIAYDATVSPRHDEMLIGTPMRNVTLDLNEQNCLRVHGPAVGQTYWPGPEDTLKDGFFQTSDIAEIVNGSVYLRGRMGDQINVAGRKVLPAVIELALKKHPAIRECLVFGVPDLSGDRTDCIVACIEAKEPVTIDCLKDFLLAIIPAWQVPRQWWFPDSIPPNPRGKLSRVEWRKRFLERVAT